MKFFSIHSDDSLWRARKQDTECSGKPKLCRCVELQPHGHMVALHLYSVNSSSPADMSAAQLSLENRKKIFVTVCFLRNMCCVIHEQCTGKCMCHFHVACSGTGCPSNINHVSIMKTLHSPNSCRLPSTTNHN